MTIRARMKLMRMVTEDWGHGTQQTVHFMAQYDQSIAEDQKFQRATPSADAKFQIDNPAALEQLKVGRDYYFDISPVPAAIQLEASDGVAVKDSGG